MNIAVIFAGGVGRRMNNRARPKQFLEINGKPIIIHTLEHFDNHPGIDAICVACLAEWIGFLERTVRKYGLQKVRWIVPGGGTALESQYNGLKKVYSEIREDCIVLLHDGVRPMIDEKTISDCIASVRQFGTAVTVAPATETVIEQDENAWIQKAYDRSKCMVARAPQCFYLKEILGLHEQSVRDGNHTFIDSTSMMLHYGHEVHTVTGAPVNIKVTTAEDFYICRALLSAREDSQLYGL